MKQAVGIGISLTVMLALAVAGYMVYNNQTPQGASGAAGVGSPILLEIDDLAGKSDMVVLGEVASTQNVTKTVSDTSQPVDLRVDDYSIAISQIAFTVDGYLEGSGEDTITISMQADDRYKGPSLSTGTQYVVFLFDPSLQTGGDFWGDTYLTLGAQGIWEVNGTDVVRVNPPLVLTLDDLKGQVTRASP